MSFNTKKGREGMDKELHICIRDDCYIHYFLERVQIRIGLYDLLEVNAFQASILELCQKSPTVNQLISNVFDTYQIEDSEHNRKLIVSLIDFFEKQRIINLKKESKPLMLAHYGEIGKAYPAWIILEITSKCNLECDFCYKSASVNGRVIDMSNVDTVIDHFAGKCKNIVITGGEALMHPQITEIIEKTAKYFDVSLLTNGLLLSRLDNGLIQKLVHIQISLYGYDNCSYRENTGIENGFDLLKESYRSILNCKSTTFVATVVLNKKNVGFIEKYIEAACEIGVPAIHFGLMLPLGKGAESVPKDIFLNNEEIIAAVTIIDELANSYIGKIHVSKLKMIREAIPLIEDEFACQAGKTNIVINQDGSVRACNLLPESVFSEYSLAEYINDVENGKTKCYSSDIQSFKNYLNLNGYELSDMKCVGFCELKG